MEEKAIMIVLFHLKGGRQTCRYQGGEEEGREKKEKGSKSMVRCFKKKGQMNCLLYSRERCDYPPGRKKKEARRELSFDGGREGGGREETVAHITLRAKRKVEFPERSS